MFVVIYSSRSFALSLIALLTCRKQTNACTGKISPFVEFKLVGDNAANAPTVKSRCVPLCCLCTCYLQCWTAMHCTCATFTNNVRKRFWRARAWRQLTYCYCVCVCMLALSSTQTEWLRRMPILAGRTHSLSNVPLLLPKACWCPSTTSTVWKDTCCWAKQRSTLLTFTHQTKRKTWKSICKSKSSIRPSDIEPLIVCDSYHHFSAVVLAFRWHFVVV